MSCWEILGIKPTKELKQIKKAYAVKLKQLIPDEQPEEFQQLKEAFDWAIKYAKDEATAVPPPLHFEQPAPVSVNLEESMIEPTFKEKLDQLVATDTFFDDLAAWEQLLADNQTWAIQEFIENARVIQHFLVENFMYLARPILALLFQTFQLNELKNEATGQSLALPGFLYKREEIMQYPDFSFALWPELSAADRKDYFFYRYIYYYYLNSETLELVRLKEMAKKIENLFTSDGDFMLLQAWGKLIDVKGNLKQPLMMKEFSQLLDQAMRTAYGNKQLASFLLIYRRAWQTGELSEFNRVQIEEGAYLSIPFWQPYLSGMLYYQVADYSRAFACWQRVSYYQFVALQPYLRKVEGKLSNEEQDTFRQMRRFYDLEREPAVPVAQKKSRDTYKHLKVILILCVAVLTFYVRVFQTVKTSESKQDQIERLQLQQEKLKEIPSPFSIERLIGEDTDAVQQFVYYYLCTSDVQERQNFNNEMASWEVRELLSQHMNDEIRYPDATNLDFTFETDYATAQGHCQAVKYKGNTILIVKLNEDEKIVDILGQGWHEIDPAAFNELVADIQIRPSLTINFFVSNYLVSEEREELLKEYPEYCTEEMLERLIQKQGEGPTEKYRNGTWQISSWQNQLYLVINDNQDQPGMILSFDEQGRLAHVYLDGWEAMDEKTVKQILDQRTAEKHDIL